jgi:integrase
MATVVFYLKSAQRKSSSIYFDFSYDKKRIQSPTGLSIEPKNWQSSKGFVKTQYERYPIYKQQLNRTKELIENFYFEKKAEGKSPLPNEIKEYLKSNLNTPEKTKDECETDFILCFNEYIQAKSNYQAPGSVMIYKLVLKELIKFSKSENINLIFKNIDLTFYDKYKTYLLNIENPNANAKAEKGMMNDTIAKRISNLKTFLKWAYERRYHTNTDYQRFKYSKSQKNEIVSLNQTELKKLIKLDLSNNKRLERVRDLFLFGVFTGQRWSDIEAFDKADIKNNTWIFLAKKTRKYTTIPFIGYCNEALVILNKYENELPKISGQKFNEYLKEVGELAKINEEVIINRFSGNKNIKISKPKYEFMTSHMARRTCVTILLEKGVPATTIMKLTGHTDLRVLLKYENTSQDALINALTNISI